MSTKWLYICGVCSEEMKSTTPSIACTSCLQWVHLRQCAKLSLKEAKQKRKVFKCDVCANKDVVSKKYYFFSSYYILNNSKEEERISLLKQ